MRGAARTLKAHTLLMTAYASGLRLSELYALRGCDIDSAPDRMCIRVVLGKGNRDWYSLLTAHLSRVSEFSPVWSFKFPHLVEIRCRRVNAPARP